MIAEDSALDRIYKIFFESASEAVIVTNKQGKILVSNPRTWELFEYAPEELINQRIDILIPEKYKHNHQQHVDKYVEKPIRRSMGNGMTLFGRKKSGVEFPVEVSLNYFKEEEETYVTALITDITNRKKIEDEIITLNKNLEAKVEERTQKLKESEALYSLIARNFPNGTINVFDRNLNYVFVEGEDLYKLGIVSKQLVGTSYISRLPAEVALEIKDNLLSVFQGKGKSFEIKLKKGVYQLNAVPLNTSNGTIDQILVVEQNITIKKQLEENMRNALEKERELNELKSRFVSMASHEFRTPLSTILSSANLALKYETEEQKESREKHLKRIKSNVQNLTSILNDFLSISKLEEGKINASISQVDFNSICLEVIEELEESLKIGQKINYKHDGPTNIFSDKNILKNIMVNMISNAIKYSQENKVITIYNSVSVKHLNIIVKDEGLGIPVKDQLHLFERFFRGQNVTNIQGTGLGLNIVKKYVDLLQGTIRFKSEENKGTEFTIVLPI